jgi:DNA replication protein DnaC
MATKTKPAGDLVYLCRELKAPSLARAVERLAERARTDGWTHEEFMAACLEREVAARQANGGDCASGPPASPARKTLEEFDFDHPARYAATSSPTSATRTSSPSARAWCSWDRREPARREQRHHLGNSASTGP